MGRDISLYPCSNMVKWFSYIPVDISNFDKRIHRLLVIVLQSVKLFLRVVLVLAAKTSPSVCAVHVQSFTVHHYCSSLRARNRPCIA